MVKYIYRLKTFSFSIKSPFLNLLQHKKTRYEFNSTPCFFILVYFYYINIVKTVVYLEFFRQIFCLQ